MLLAIIWAAGIMLVTATCFQLLEDGKLFERPFKVFDKIDLSMWGISASLGVVVGGIQYFIPHLRGHLWLAPIFLVIMLAAMVGVIVWGRMRACEVKEFLWLSVLLFLLTLATKAIAVATTALVTQPFWASLITNLPWLVFVAGVGVFVVFFFYYREELTAGRIFMGIFTAILAIILITGCEWNSFPLDFGKNSKAEMLTVSEKPAPAKTVGEDENDAIAKISSIVSLSDAEFEKILEFSGLKGAVLNRNSLPSAKKDRLFEDAISTPMTEPYKEELYDELRNPIWLAARFERLSEIVLANGKTIADECPAIVKYVELFDKKGIEYFVENQDKNGEFPLTTEYLRYAVIGELLFDCTEVSVQKDVTTKYVWRLDEMGAYLADGTFDLSKIKAVKKEYTEDEEYNDVIVITHITKEKVLYVEYFDMYDRAPVILGDTPVTPKTPEITPTNEPGTPGTDPTPTDEPGTPGTDPEDPEDPEGPDDPDGPPAQPKDKTKGTQGDVVAENDDTGSGSSTNNGNGSKTSTEDNSTNSNHLTYDEYAEVIKEIEETEEETTAAAPTSGVTVDDNASTGTGYGNADEQTPTQGSATTGGRTITNDESNPAGSWGGPSD